MQAIVASARLLTAFGALMSSAPRHIVVTSALPYANGPLHLGHLLETIQSDIWVRFQRMQGHTCIHVCGSDAHGTAIMLQAEKLGCTPEALVAKIQAEHAADYKDFLIDFNEFYTTHSEENKELADHIYSKLQANGDITSWTLDQAYDPIKNLFLPDRFIKGTCPRCDAPDQYGDNCEACGATYTPTDLKNPVSTLSGVTPIQKSSVHYFFDLARYADMLKSWIHTGTISSAMTHKLEEWFEMGLKPWDISRDAPYFGFEIPNAPGKYFYVWLDAPIGYMASLQHFANRTNQPALFDQVWNAKSTTELYHFIGKDIIYFHALFWPALLQGAGFRLPTRIFSHGFLTIQGQKMSKSRGTFITARQYLDAMDPQYLRYYFASKLGPGIDDIDFDPQDFTHRINADLVGKLVNIASRCARLLDTHFARTLCDLHDADFYTTFVTAGADIAASYDILNYNQAVRHIMRLTDDVNRYIDHHQPWAQIKDATQRTTVHQVLSMGLQVFRVLMGYLKPVLPKMAQSVETFLCIPALTWETIATPLPTGHTIAPFQPLAQRVDMGAMGWMQPVTNTTTPTTKKSEKKVTSQESMLPGAAATPATTTSTISIDDFMKVDLRIAKIINAEHVEGAEKLLRLTLDIGEDKPRQVFAGIKSAYAPETLIGRLTVMVANLAPRTMRFGISEGMVLAAGPGGSDLWILSPDAGAAPGMKVK